MLTQSGHAKSVRDIASVGLPKEGARYNTTLRLIPSQQTPHGDARSFACGYTLLEQSLGKAIAHPSSGQQDHLGSYG